MIFGLADTHLNQGAASKGFIALAAMTFGK
jgi:ABC-type uncharacterized transport system permease subunit